MLTRVTRSRAALAAGTSSSTTSPPPPITRPVPAPQQKRKKTSSAKPQSKLTKSFKVTRFNPNPEKKPSGYPAPVYAAPTADSTEPFADEAGPSTTITTQPGYGINAPPRPIDLDEINARFPPKKPRPRKEYVPFPDLGPVPPLPDLPPSEILKAGIAHLKKVSPPLRPIIDKYDFTNFMRAHAPTDTHPFNPFRTIGQGILSQQISGTAAAAVTHRFKSLFYHGSPVPAASGTIPEQLPLHIPEPFWPTPEAVWATNTATLRSAGLSGRKTEYMHALAAAFIRDESLWSREGIMALSDAELINKLTQIHGIGVWSAEMFLIFGLGRWDVFAIDDLGIQRGMAVWHGKNSVKSIRGFMGDGEKGKWKYMKEEKMRELAERFRPYRSLFCLLMWRVGDTNTAVLESEDPELVGEEEAERQKKRRKKMNKGNPAEEITLQKVIAVVKGGV